MKKGLLLPSYLLAFALGAMLYHAAIPQTTLPSTDSMHDEHSVELPHQHDAGHMHERQDISDWENTPTLDMVIEQDAKSGWNIHLVTEHFQFAPESVNTQAENNQGHAHLYIDDQKITRLYHEWYYLPELTPGEHIIKVTLNSNDHKDLVIADQVISASKTITAE